MPRFVIAYLKQQCFFWHRVVLKQGAIKLILAFIVGWKWEWYLAVVVSKRYPVRQLHHMTNSCRRKLHYDDAAGAPRGRLSWRPHLVDVRVESISRNALFEVPSNYAIRLVAFYNYKRKYPLVVKERDTYVCACLRRVCSFWNATTNKRYCASFAVAKRLSGVGELW